MANEATIRASMTIQKGSLYYSSLPSGFSANVNATNPFGPFPGSIIATTRGTHIVFAGYVNWPSLCRIMNNDPTNLVTVGLWDPVLGRFFPTMELLPGESYIFRISRYLGHEYTTGTGTIHTEGPVDAPTLTLKADVASCICLVEAFDY